MLQAAFPAALRFLTRSRGPKVGRSGVLEFRYRYNYLICYNLALGGSDDKL